MKFNGSELAYTPGLSSIARLYIKIFGAPINGLRIRIRRIIPQISGSPSKILDAGCGRGVFTFLLARIFPAARITAVDTDHEQLALNRRLTKELKLKNVDFVEHDVTDLTYHEEFDVVLSVDNIEHIKDDQKALQALADSLKDAGRLYLHVPAFERRWFFFRFRTNFDVPGHFRPGYTIEDIRDKVADTGLKIMKAFYTYGWLENLSNNISYFITGAEARNKVIYALLFPFLNTLAWLGRNSRPEKGAGILIIAEKIGRD